MPARLEPVKGSSNIAAVGYDNELNELSIRFHNGRTYTYEGVPAEVHTDLLDAASMGQHFNTHIKDAYKHR